jgi:hypothetical protein
MLSLRGDADQLKIRLHLLSQRVHLTISFEADIHRLMSVVQQKEIVKGLSYVKKAGMLGSSGTGTEKDHYRIGRMGRSTA